MVLPNSPTVGESASNKWIPVKSVSALQRWSNTLTQPVEEPLHLARSIFSTFIGSPYPLVPYPLRTCSECLLERWNWLFILDKSLYMTG